MINTVLIGSNEDFNAVPDVIYPVCNLQFLSENKRGNLLNTQFEIVIADLLNDTSDNELDIYSDANQIASDAISYFSNQEEYDISDSISLQKFSNGTVDNTSGVLFIIQFSQWFDTCLSSLPIKDNINPTIEDVFQEPFEESFGSDEIYTQDLIFFRSGIEDGIVDINDYKSSNLVSATFYTEGKRRFNILVKSGETIKVFADETNLSDELMLVGSVSVNNELYSHFILEVDTLYYEIKIEL